jgi:t-SNARE complex subunit (syntaxin)
MDYDENKNAVIDQISTEAVDGHDANKVDDMIEKALSKPAMVDKSNIIIIILCILILIGVIVVLVKTFQLDKTINSLQIIGKV